jgi:hypothetical protein
MIVLGPVLFIFCLGIFCLIMDSIYPEENIETLIVRSKSIPRDQTVASSDYDRYEWNDDSDLVVS